MGIETTPAHHRSGATREASALSKLRALLLAGIAAGLLSTAAAASAAPPAASPPSTSAGTRGPAMLPVRRVRFDYRTHDGKTSWAIVLLPGWYGPSRHPALPLIICPHGRNTSPESTAKRWRDLPTRGGFAVVLPAGQGRVLQLDSWGYPGQIADLARMPKLVEHAVPGFHYLRKRLYAVGESMGGQEVLLLLARHPHMFAGVIAFDPAVDMVSRYYAFPSLFAGVATQRKALTEIGGNPQQVPRAYAVRSPIDYVHPIAFSEVPLQIWWSIADRVITDQASQAGRLYQEIKLANPTAPVSPYVGRWQHTAEGIANTQLPDALARIGLLPASWLINDPLRLHHGPGAVPAGRLASETEVDRMVTHAQLQASQRLARESGLVSAWWRTAFVAAAVLCLLLAAALTLSLRRPDSRARLAAGRDRLTRRLRAPRPPSHVA
jgi:pimeloyl-ACP methyl ester carboxylesterase